MKAYPLILLAGLPGCGKTTLGHSLAHHLSLGFLDLDQWIEKTSTLTIAQIFQQKNEAEFRKYETQALAEVLGAHNHIIALGGGTLSKEENRKKINHKKALTLYLKHHPSSLSTQVSSLLDLKDFLRSRPTFWPLLEKTFKRPVEKSLWNDDVLWSQNTTKNLLRTELKEHYQNLLTERKEDYLGCELSVDLSYSTPHSAFYILKEHLKDLQKAPPHIPTHLKE